MGGGARPPVGLEMVAVPKRRPVTSHKPGAMGSSVVVTWGSQEAWVDTSGQARAHAACIPHENTRHLRAARLRPHRQTLTSGRLPTALSVSRLGVLRVPETGAGAKPGVTKASEAATSDAPTSTAFLIATCFTAPRCVTALEMLLYVAT
jgi:hypothetical protein